MKIVMAVFADRSEVLALLPNGSDEVVTMNEWLSKIRFPERRPLLFKVYHTITSSPWVLPSATTSWPITKSHIHYGGQVIP